MSDSRNSYSKLVNLFDTHAEARDLNDLRFDTQSTRLL